MSIADARKPSCIQISRSANTMSTTAASNFGRLWPSWSQATGTSRNRFFILPPANVDHDLGPRIGKSGHSGAIFRGQLDADFNDACIDVGHRVVAENHLAAYDEIFANDDARQFHAQGWHSNLGRLADAYLADILLVD